MRLVIEDIKRISEIMYEGEFKHSLIEEEILLENELLFEQPEKLLQRAKSYITKEVENIIDRYTTRSLERTADKKLDEFILNNKSTPQGKQLIRNLIRDISEANSDYAKFFTNERLESLKRYEASFKGDRKKAMEALELRFGKNVRYEYERLNPVKIKVTDKVNTALSQSWDEIGRMNDAMIRKIEAQYAGFGSSLRKFKEDFISTYFKDANVLMEETLSLAKTLETAGPMEQEALMLRISDNLKILGEKQMLFFKGFDNWLEKNIPDRILRTRIRNQKGYNRVKALYDNTEIWKKETGGNFGQRKKEVRNAVGLILSRVDLLFGLFKNTKIKPFGWIEYFLDSGYRSEEMKKSLMELMKTPKFAAFKNDMLYGMTLKPKQIFKYYELFGGPAAIKLVSKELVYGFFICACIEAFLDLVTDILAYPISKIYPKNWHGYSIIDKNAKSFNIHWKNADEKISFLEKQANSIDNTIFRGAAVGITKFLSYFTDILSETPWFYLPGEMDTLGRLVTSLVDKISSMNPITPEEVKTAQNDVRNNIDTARNQILPIVDTIANRARDQVDSLQNNQVTPTVGTYQDSEFGKFHLDSLGVKAKTPNADEYGIYKDNVGTSWEYCDKLKKFVTNIDRDCE